MLSLAHGQQLFSMLFTKLRFVYLQAIKVLIMKSKVLQKEIVHEGKVTALKLYARFDLFTYSLGPDSRYSYSGTSIFPI